MSANNQVNLVAASPLQVLVDRDEVDLIQCVVLSDVDCSLVLGEGVGSQFPLVANTPTHLNLDRGTKLSALRNPTAGDGVVSVMYWRDPANEVTAEIRSLNECLSELVCLLRGER